MPEPIKQVPGGFFEIDPENSTHRRTWPDPRASKEACWKAAHSPKTLTLQDVRRLASAAEAYAYVFSVSQKTFLPSHSAIRAHLAKNGEKGGEGGDG